MAFRRSAVRSRLAPPPGPRRFRLLAGVVMAYSPDFSSMLIVRLVLGLLLLVGVTAGMRIPENPARAAALAAGALCLGDRPAGVPQDGYRHNHCLTCLSGVSLGGLLAGAPGILAFGAAEVTRGTTMPRQIREAGRASYAPRAPPWGLG